MDKIVIALVPAFTAGFAIQQFLEICAPLFTKVDEKNKKMIMQLISLVLGGIFAMLGIRILVHLMPNALPWLDGIVTALVISAGTEGVNSVMKFLGYTKEKEHADAVEKTMQVEKKEGGAEAMAKM
jgi:F0F1-type ATP synthase assembly protein I